MFKSLILQALDGLSDEQAEFQTRDRLSFLRFLGFGMNDPVGHPQKPSLVEFGRDSLRLSPLGAS